MRVNGGWLKMHKPGRGVTEFSDPEGPELTSIRVASVCLRASVVRS